MRIVVTSGYGKSLHAVALVHGLAERGHEVVLCLSVLVLQMARLRFYLRQLGWRRFWAKGRAKLLPGRNSAGGMGGEVAAMLEYMGEHGIASRNVAQACRRVGAKLVRVRALNTPRALGSLRAARPDLVVYGGGGILRREFLETPRCGVLNAHGGPLPHFRGMNSSEWALFHGVRPAVVAHYMDCGIDTGPVLARESIPLETQNSIAHLRGVATRVSVELLLETVDRIATGSVSPAPQRIEDGRQFFVMAEPLLEVVQRWLDEGRTPKMDAEEFRFPPGPVRTSESP